MWDARFLKVKEEALSQARIYEWFSRFKHGDMSPEDQPRSGRPATNRSDENILKIRDAIMFDNRGIIDELEALDWSFVELMSTNFNRNTKRVASASR
jgi:hypothetical protein